MECSLLAQTGGLAWASWCTTAAAPPYCTRYPRNCASCIHSCLSDAPSALAACIYPSSLPLTISPSLRGFLESSGLGRRQIRSAGMDAAESYFVLGLACIIKDTMVGASEGSQQILAHLQIVQISGPATQTATARHRGADPWLGPCLHAFEPWLQKSAVPQSASTPRFILPTVGHLEKTNDTSQPR